MPRGDRTGPAGAGPMTGRGAGFCAGTGVPGFENPLYRSFRNRGRGFFSPFGYGGFGAGFGRGMGRGFFGRGMGRTFGIYNEPRDEKEYLLSEKKILEKDLEEVKRQIELIDEELNKDEGNV
ncbi:MAG: DUF5320 domain-containing protein [Spirochaetales bacterium]|nr:DUF5320 domain-containing protein [Spirochaetales bacterium]